MFTVKLPLLSEWSSERLTGEVVRLPPAVHPEAAPTELSTALKGLRILVVDDEPGSRELLLTLLSHCGAEVVSGSSATEALAELTRFKPDVLISDIEMPEEDGYVLVRKLRSLEDDLGSASAQWR